MPNNSFNALSNYNHNGRYINNAPQNFLLSEKIDCPSNRIKLVSNGGNGGNGGNVNGGDAGTFNASNTLSGLTGAAGVTVAIQNTGIAALQQVGVTTMANVTIH